MSNLFNPPKFVNGSLEGIDGNAFVLMGHFKTIAKRQGWKNQEIESVINKCMSGTYDQLIQTLLCHMKD